MEQEEEGERGDGGGVGRGGEGTMRLITENLVQVYS